MNHIFQTSVLIMECIELNWLGKHMKKMSSSQPAIPVLNWVKHQSFPVSIVKLLSLWVSLSCLRVLSCIFTDRSFRGKKLMKEKICDCLSNTSFSSPSKVLIVQKVFVFIQKQLSKNFKWLQLDSNPQPLSSSAFF